MTPMKEHYRHSFITLLMVLAALLYAMTATAATINAELSRNPVSIDESFELVFTVEGEADEEPDFSPLERDFQILDRSQNQNIQMINGRYSRSLRWILTLMAKRSGELQIPAIAFGNEHSNPLKIKVAAASPDSGNKADGDVFLEVSLEPGTAYVQQQLIYRARLFRAVNISEASLSEPSISDPDAIIEQLGDEQSYETRRHGRRYLVNEINYAIFPQNSGTLHVEPLVFQGRLMQRTHSRGFRSPFDVFEQAGPLKRWRSDAQVVTVIPLPTNAKGKPWLPAMGVLLTEDWPDANPQFKVGEPVTRTLKLQALGVSATQLPKINAGIPKDFKQYPDQATTEDHKTANGISATREEKIAIIPTKPGSYTLPAIELPWWNTETDHMEVARIPERSIQVLAASDAPNTAPGPIAQPAAITPTVPTPAIAETASLDNAGTKVVISNGGAFPYQWLSLFLAVGWLVTVGLWFLHYRRHSTSASDPSLPEPTSKQVSIRQALSDLKQACSGQDAQAAKTALLDWGAAIWPQAAPRGLGEIALRLTDKASAEIRRLERVLYANNAEPWDGMALWNALKNYRPQLSDLAAGSDSALLQLYPK